jgi:large subunit ribosomal protein L31
MKKDIHPTYYPECKVTCACGNSFITGSTQPELKIELCSACHPFYTGKQKLVDTARRVEKFQAKQTKKTELADRKGKTAKRAAKAAKKEKKEIVVKMKPEDLKKTSKTSTGKK